MKKSLVLVALASAMTLSAASAETVLYGSIRMGVQNEKGHYNASRGEETNFKRGFDMKDYGSRLGLRGSEDLGNGTKVLFQLEWGFNGMEGGSTGEGFENRLAWMGLSGDWGTFAIGRQNNPFTESLNAGTEADGFNGDYVSALRYATGSVMSASSNVSHASGSKAMPTRVGNSIAYASPTWSGFNFVAAFVADAPKFETDAATGVQSSNGTYNRSRNADIWTIGLNYEHESGFYAKAAYLGSAIHMNVKRANVYGLNVGFQNEQFGVNADYAGGSRSRQHDNGNKVTSTGWDVGGHFNFGPDYFSTVRATYGQSKVTSKYTFQTKAEDKMTVWALGFEQKLSNRTKVWVEYAKEEEKYKGWSATADGKNKFTNDKVSIGMRHDF